VWFIMVWSGWWIRLVSLIQRSWILLWSRQNWRIFTTKRFVENSSGSLTCDDCKRYKSNFILGKHKPSWKKSCYVIQCTELLWSLRKLSKHNGNWRKNEYKLHGLQLSWSLYKEKVSTVRKQKNSGLLHLIWHW